MANKMPTPNAALNNFLKDNRIYAALFNGYLFQGNEVITIVFYTGEKVRDGPTSLYDMMEIDEQLKPFVPDYPLFVIDMGHDNTLSFPNESLESLRIALWDIYHSTGDHDQTEIGNNIMALAGILANDTELY